MYFRSLIAVVLFTSVFLSGCAANITPRYSLYSSNVIALKNLAKNSDVKLIVNDFTSNALTNKEESCRGMGIMPPDGITFSSFIKNALVDELKISDMYSDTSSIGINGVMKNIELHTASINKGSWIIELEISIASGKPFLVPIDREFSSGFSGYTACENAKAAFVPTVQDLIYLVLTHPEFQKVVLSISESSQ